MRNFKNLRWLAAPCVAATGLLAVLAGPATAAARTPFEVPGQCSYFPAPTNILACLSQSGQISQTGTPAGDIITRATVTTVSAVYVGPTKEGIQLSQAKTMQYSHSVEKMGQPAAVEVRQQMNAENYAAELSCAFHVRLVMMHQHVQHARTDINCW